MHAFVTVLSYWASVLLIMPAIKTSIWETPIMLIGGTLLIAWKKPWKCRDSYPRAIVSAAVIFSVYLGYRFFTRWTGQRIFSIITTILPISDAIYHLLIIVAMVVGTALAAHFLSGIFTQIKKLISVSDPARLLARDLWCCMVASATTVLLSQVMIGVDIWSMGHLKFLCGVLVVAVIVLTVYSLIGRIMTSITLGTGLFMLISTVNVYVYAYRYRLFEPIDIVATKTAMNVIDNFNLLAPLPAVLIGWGIWLALLICIVFSCSKVKHSIPRKVKVILAACCIAASTLLFFYTATLPMLHWETQGAEVNGYVLDYVAKIREAYIAKPQGYSQDQLQEISNQYIDTPNPSAANTEYPDIIVIMDEAFSDLNILGPIQTNKEVMPFISNLRENTISGYALTSVYGGNTANSEYEFLTGNSMAWLSPGMVPYQQYVNAPSYSMASYLKMNHQYRCVAMHPYLSSGWNRPAAYANLGFDESCYLEDFPQEHYLRSYISDQEMFETIVEAYESKEDNPLFIFGVTMQNHSNYTSTYENFTQAITLVGYDHKYPAVEQYLSLIHETDKAVEYLISYFKDANGPVVIAFFGDHQPIIDGQFYDEIAKNNPDSLDEQQLKYLVPFFVWANYDIDEQYIEKTSLNYLSSYVYEAAGIPLPPYNRFLSDLEKEIPAINAYGFYSTHAQSYKPVNMASGHEQTWLKKYEQLQYNSLFDKKNRNDHFFPALD